MDDQDLTMGSPDYMPNLQSQIVSKGINIKNGYITTPVCCPSRTESITGRYFHNVKVTANNTLKSTCTGMHVDAINNLYDPYNNSLFQVLYNNGYETGVFGKLTNDDNIYFCDETFTQKPSAAGMSRVYSMCAQNNYYCPKYRNYFKNGTDNFVNLPTNQKQTYQSFQIGNVSLTWIEHKMINKQSFFAWVGFHCPHTPYTPPPWTESILKNGYLSNLTVPIDPSFNYQVKQQQPYLEQQPKLNEYTNEFMNHGYRTRIASTLQVDIYINDLIQLLEKYNQIDNTYIIYSSDHGYHFGQHRLPCEKEQMFETDIHIPYYIKGPNITENSVTNKLIGNVDMMPTVLDLANINIPDSVDGKSMKNIILNNTNKNINDGYKWRESYLVEFMANGNAYYNICGMWFASNNSNNFIGKTVRPDATQNTGNDSNLLWILYGDNKNYGDTFRLLRILNDTINWVYAEYIDYHFNETSFKNPYLYVLYDLKNDLYQLYNVYNNVTKDIQDKLHQMIMSYGSCSGSNCP